MPAVLEVKQVTKVYDKAPKPALHNVSFQVEPGEFLAIMGASGSGKTTLLNVLSTIDAPTGGEVRLGGTPLGTLKDGSAADFRRDHLGFIFQEYFLLDSLTIRENIAVPLALQKQPGAEIKARVEALAQRFGIAAQLDKYPTQLSGGQRQRASAARALIKEPRLLFADEPTGALDSASATELLQALQEANRDLGTTILLVTHDAYAASFTARVLLFRDGSIDRELHRGEQDQRTFYETIAAQVAQLDRQR